MKDVPAGLLELKEATDEDLDEIKRTLKELQQNIPERTAEELEERITGVPPETDHPVRMMVERERDHVILFDRTYHPDGEVTEPTPGW